MSSFCLTIRDGTQGKTFEKVNSFVGEDRSGSFGLLPNHYRIMTVLVMGLSRFRVADGTWQYIAAPGALLYFRDNQLSISTRHFMIDEDYSRISSALGAQLQAEETALQSQRVSLRHMEETVLKRLRELGQYRQ